MKRIPRIKFPQRHPKSSGSGAPPPPPAAGNKGSAQSVSQVQAPPASGATGNYRFKSDVPAAPSYTAVGGKASLLPKRTPLSEKEIEAIMLGGCF